MKNLLIILSILFSTSCSAKNIQTATFASGCFWCTEAIFEQLKGVTEVSSGYMGGKKDNPTYKEVSSGTTGHAEVIQLKYDADIVSYETLLEVFWETHDPTTLNQQGADKGTQYRSAIFYHTDAQRKSAEEYRKKLNEAKIWNKLIVTEITAASKFYPAEKDHQDFYTNNKNNNSYCTYVITPKLEKFRKVFGDNLK